MAVVKAELVAPGDAADAGIVVAVDAVAVVAFAEAFVVAEAAGDEYGHEMSQCHVVHLPVCFEVQSL